MILKENIKYFLFYFATLFIALYQSVLELSLLSIPSYIVNFTCYSVAILVVIFIVLNRKNIRFKSFFLYILLYFSIALFQTYNYDSSIFFNRLPSLLMSTSMVVLCLLPLELKDNEKIILSKYIDFLYISIIVITLFIDILCFKSLFIDNLIDAITGQHNTLGAYNSALFIVSMSLFFRTDNKYFKFGFILLALIGLVFNYKTTSRASLLTILVFLFFFCIHFLIKHFNKYKYYFFFVFILCLVLAFAFKDELLYHLLRYGYYNNGNFLNAFTSGRTQIWFSAFPATMKGHWLFGNGIYTVRNQMLDSVAYLQNTFGLSYSIFHCFIFDVLFAAGIFGIIFFILSFVYIFKYIKNSKKHDFFTYLSIVIIIAFICAGLFDVYFIWDEVTFNYLIVFVEFFRLINLTKGANNEN